MTAVVANPPFEKPASVALAQANKLLKDYAELEASKALMRENMKQVEATQDIVKIQLHQWAQANAEAFAGKKSLALDGGDILFKKEGERIVWDAEKTPADYEAKMLKLVQAEYSAAIEPKVNPKSLLKAWAVLPKLRKALEKLGASVRNDDKFTIILKRPGHEQE